MSTVWSPLLELSPANRILVAIAAAVGAVWVWTTLAAHRRRRARTVYVVPGDRRFVDQPAIGSDDVLPPVSADAPTFAWSPDWADGRRLCPCCDYPTDYSVAHACSLCDWQEPPEPELAPWYTGQLRVEISEQEDPDDALQAARACYRTTGSAFMPEDRAEFNGTLTPQALDLRNQIRDRLDYLRIAERPDTSETWELIDHLFDELRDAMR